MDALRRLPSSCCMLRTSVSERPTNRPKPPISLSTTPFAAKLSPAGSLEYATYLGPSVAGAQGIAIDQSGNAYITGTTASNDLPVVNAFQPEYAGDICTSCSNAFVQKLDPTGSQLVYSTYFSAGGLGTESSARA